jgi:hypothetical protein
MKKIFLKFFDTKIAKKGKKNLSNFCWSPLKKSSAKKNFAEKAEAIFNTNHNQAQKYNFSIFSASGNDYCPRGKNGKK